MSNYRIHGANFPSRALISKKAFVHNLRLARKWAKDAEIMAVIKADGYGHGAVEVGAWALGEGVNWLAVAQLGEAIELRKALNRRGRMLALIAEPGAPFRQALELGIDLSVSASWALDEIVAAAIETGIPARVHLEVDTGMSRAGFLLPELKEIMPQFAAYVRGGLIRPVGLWSHLACADDPQSEVTARQTAVFEEAREILREAGITVEFCHLAASGGILWHPQTHYSMVRPGCILYGISPEPKIATAEELGLRAVMKLEADVVSVRDVPAGTGVSYGHTAVLGETTRLATVPLGYADGIPRHASNTAEVVTGRRRCKVVGRICMDQFVIEAPQAVPGDTVTVFGDAKDAVPTADDWGAVCDTIGYEIVCRLGTRVPRYYVD